MSVTDNTSMSQTETDVKKDCTETGPTTATHLDCNSNPVGAFTKKETVTDPSLLESMQNEGSFVATDDGGDGGNGGCKKEESDNGSDHDGDSSVKSEGADEEDALFSNLELKQEQEAAAQKHQQPVDAKEAPMLLKSAFEKGDVVMDEESKNDVQKGNAADGDAASEKNVVHQRVRIIWNTV